MKKLHLKYNRGFTRQNSLKRISGGFTLLETLIAIFIMVVAFTSLLSLMTTSMFSARYANNEITATYLVQEAVDYVRNDRDTTAFQGSNWVGFLLHYGNYLGTPSGCYSTSGCIVDVTDTTYSSATIVPCPPAPLGCPNFLYEDLPMMSGGYYTYTPSSTTSSTKFKRTVYMELNGSDELLITVQVDWFNGLKPRSQTLKASVLKWQ